MSILTAAGITFGDSTSQTTAAVTGVTSLAAGNGITVSGATGAVTVSQDFYNGTTSTNTSYPISTYLYQTIMPAPNPNNTTQVWVSNAGSQYGFVNSVANGGVSQLAGTWKMRGYGIYPCGQGGLVQRTA